MALLRHTCFHAYYWHFTGDMITILNATGLLTVTSNYNNSTLDLTNNTDNNNQSTLDYPKHTCITKVNK